MSEISERNDEEIATQVQKGDIESFRVLVERYEPKDDPVCQAVLL